jgi:ankyrin repeat protein
MPSINKVKTNGTGDTDSDINQIFVRACTNGDHQKVLTILNLIKDFNIDVADNMGRTALRLAITNEHLDVIELKYIIFFIN